MLELEVGIWSFEGCVSFLGFPRPANPLAPKTENPPWFPRSCATEMAPTTGNSMYRPYYAVEFPQILPAVWKQAIIDKSTGGFASETLRHVGYGVGFVQIGAPSIEAGRKRASNYQ